MTTAAIVLLVCFVVVMLVWLLAMLGVGGPDDARAKASPWLCWFACLFLGMAVFAAGMFR